MTNDLARDKERVIRELIKRLLILEEQVDEHQTLCEGELCRLRSELRKRRGLVLELLSREDSTPVA